MISGFGLGLESKAVEADDHIPKITGEAIGKLISTYHAHKEKTKSAWNKFGAGSSNKMKALELFYIHNLNKRQGQLTSNECFEFLNIALKKNLKESRKTEKILSSFLPLFVDLRVLTVLQNAAKTHDHINFLRFHFELMCKVPTAAAEICNVVITLCKARQEARKIDTKMPLMHSLFNETKEDADLSVNIVKGIKKVSFWQNEIGQFDVNSKLSSSDLFEMDMIYWVRVQLIRADLYTKEVDDLLTRLVNKKLAYSLQYLVDAIRDLKKRGLLNTQHAETVKDVLLTPVAAQAFIMLALLKDKKPALAPKKEMSADPVLTGKILSHFISTYYQTEPHQSEKMRALASYFNTTLNKKQGPLTSKELFNVSKIIFTKDANNCMKANRMLASVGFLFLDLNVLSVLRHEFNMSGSIDCFEDHFKLMCERPELAAQIGSVAFGGRQFIKDAKKAGTSMPLMSQLYIYSCENAELAVAMVEFMRKGKIWNGDVATLAEMDSSENLKWYGVMDKLLWILTRLEFAGLFNKEMFEACNKFINKGIDELEKILNTLFEVMSDLYKRNILDQKHEKLIMEIISHPMNSKLIVDLFFNPLDLKEEKKSPKASGLGLFSVKEESKQESKEDVNLLPDARPALSG